MYLKSLVGAGALCLTALAAEAETIVLDDYAGYGVRVENGLIRLDLFGGGDDFSQADGNADIEINVTDTQATLNTVRHNELAGRQGYDSILQSGGVVTGAFGGLISFDEDGLIGGDDRFGVSPQREFLYGNDDDVEVLARAGDRGVFGFVLEFSGACLDSELCQAPPLNHDGMPEEPGLLDLPLRTIYGWIQLQRGSITPLALGFNTVSGQAATVTGTTTTPPPAAVPLPAAGWMLLAGFGGLAALTRRKR